MSNEIKIQASLTVDNGNFKLPKLGASLFKFDQNTPGGGNPGTIQVGLTEETVDLSEVSTPGWIWMKNLDADNSVLWGPKRSTWGSGSSGSEDDGYMEVCGKMEPGEPVLFRVAPGVDLMLRALVASCRVQVIVIED